ncbi:TonB-dependent receptor [Sphingomonas populi]|uniref:TonB-dependent receptor n=1 Tax=Sphingomonas populi TaxID=2484750 RepID=A0A4Q6XSW3_9SPHN|nr:carboxypeptidase regulatory-like domain-containing protein [Sphingomonas populi]RZF63583.1 TonB-dependent receptor [Sphingomonas populi]
MRNQLLMGAAIAALVMPAAASAQETTATVRGSVVAQGAPVAGAAVVIESSTTGARSTATTDSSGSFNFNGLQAGGPYTLTVTSAQGNSTITDIFTVVGQPYDLPVDLAEQTGGSDIVVTANRVQGAGVRSDGPQTILTATDIARVASVNRDIRDLARRDPFARFEDTSGSGGGKAISFAGVNPRYNKFSVDGVTVSDNFGLNSDANPTRRGPVPLDAIGQFSTSVAPYDVRQGGFQGGAMDAILKSGTNKFHGSGFFSYNSDGLTGDARRLGATKLNFDSKTYGVTLSGPIIKDKLFFMVSGERNTEGNPLSPAPGQVPNLTQSLIDSVTSAAKTAFPDYNVGGVLTSSSDKDEKIVGKITWNISDRQKLSLSYINAYDETNFLQNSNTSRSTPQLGLSSDAYKATELLRAGIVQLNSDWTDHLSTEARFLYKSYDRGQLSLGGNAFGQNRVCTAATSITNGNNGDSFIACGSGAPGVGGNPVVTFGPDSSRQSNVFNTDTYSGSFLIRYNAGNHDIKLYTQYDQVKIFNLFLQNTRGNWYYDSTADLASRTASSVTYQNAATGNPNDAAASFGYQQYQFGLQDDWRVNDQLTITAGVRYDLYGSHSPVPLNPGFTARYGFPNTLNYSGLGLLQPRVSFNYKPVSDISIRGGFGIFGGGSPDVYLSNSYSSAGAGIGGVGITSLTINRTGTNTYTLNGASIDPAIASAILHNPGGATIPAQLQALIPNGPNSLANINALSRDFRIPSVYKGTLSADWTPNNLLGGGWDFGADFYWSKVKDQVYFTDLRSIPIGTLPDGRTRYGPLIGSDTNTDIILANTSKGRSYIGVVRAAKTFDFGLDLDVSYTLQDVKDQTPATSSTAGSNYGNGAFLDGSGAAYGVSNDQSKWSFKYGVGFHHAFFGDNTTTFQLFGSTNAGRPYSITMQDLGTGNRSSVFGVTGRDDRFLLYVPTGPNDPLINMTPEVAAALDKIIVDNGLERYRGKILPRNVVRSRAYTQMDLHVAQELPLFVGKSKLTLFGDIQNFPNLLNKKWGGFRQAAFPYVEDVISVTCATVDTNTCAKYNYTLPITPNTSVAEIKPSLYFIRIGARVSF